MSESQSAGSRWDSRIGTASGVLLVLCGLMVGLGFVMPSPAVTAKEHSKPGYQAMAAPAAPVRLVVPSLKVRAPVLPIEVNSEQVLDPPRNPRDIGWWKRSARPGETQGQTVMTGHTVHTGGGVMDDLGKLHRGHLVRVVTPKGTMVYRTTKVVTLTREQLAKRSVALFSQDREPVRLVLITCSGWTGSYYTSNVVAFAKPLGVRAKRHPST